MTAVPDPCRARPAQCAHPPRDRPTPGDRGAGCLGMHRREQCLGVADRLSVDPRHQRACGQAGRRRRAAAALPDRSTVRPGGDGMARRCRRRPLAARDHAAAYPSRHRPTSPSARRWPRTRLRSLEIRRRPYVITRPSRRKLGVAGTDYHGRTAATNLMTMVTLRSITRTLETDLLATEFAVLPIFGPTGQPEYQVEIHVSHPDILRLDELNTALENAQNELRPGVSAH